MTNSARQRPQICDIRHTRDLTTKPDSEPPIIRRSQAVIVPGLTVSVEKDRAESKILDVQGGEIGNAKREPGKLFVAERALNILAAHHRFHLSSYNRVPEDGGDAKSVHGNPRVPVFGKFDKTTSQIFVFLREDNESDALHIENVLRLSNSSIMVGHLDPPGLIPVFNKLGVRPPSILVYGDLLAVEQDRASDAERVMPEALKGKPVKPFWFEWQGLQYIDIFDKKQTVSPRDFRIASLDCLAEQQLEAINIGNTKYFEHLPSFCRVIELP